MVTEWNRKAADMLGYPKEDAIGKNMVQCFIEPENRQSVNEILVKASRGPERPSPSQYSICRRSQTHVIGERN